MGEDTDGKSNSKKIKKIKSKDVRQSKKTKKTKQPEDQKTKKTKKVKSKPEVPDTNVSVDRDEDIADDELGYKNLLKSIQSLDGKRAPIIQRSEPSIKASEYHNGSVGKIEFGQLLKPLSSNGNLKQQFEKKDKDLSQKLEKPQEKLVIHKAERQTTYVEAKSEADKWQTVVEENRVAPHQRFPLEKSKISITSSSKEAASHQPRTALELEIQAMLKGPDYVAKLDEEASKPVLTKAEREAQKAMDLHAAREELSLRRRHRRMVADAASKHKRQNKIKSRSFRRHLKASRRKEAFKALEKLKSENPELWQEKAEEIERARIEERATLRHKGKNKFAKLAKRYGKFNEKIKDSLDEMRAKGVELLKKRPLDEVSSNSEEEDVGSDLDMSASDSDADEDESDRVHEVTQHNPWMLSRLSKEKVSRPAKSTAHSKVVEDNSDEEASDDSDDESYTVKDSGQVEIYTPDLTDSSQVKASVEDEESSGEEEQTLLDDIVEMERDADEMIEGQSTERIQSLNEVERFDKRFHEKQQSSTRNGNKVDGVVDNEDSEDDGKDNDKDVDHNKVIVIPTTDLSGSDHINHGYSSDDEENHQRLNIAQAFADDDVVEEFATRKKRRFEEEDAEAEAAIALNKLPGWGHWSGAGIVPLSKRKMSAKQKRRLKQQQQIKALEQAKKDEERNKKYPRGVIVNEKALNSQPIAKYQVADLKQPYDKQTFETMMSYPVGRDFIPTVAHNEIVRPKVLTSAGTIIEPLDKDQIIDAEKKNQKSITFPRSTAERGKRLAKQYQLKLGGKELKEIKLERRLQV